MQTTQNKTTNEQNNAVANQIENNNSGSELSLNTPEYNSQGADNVLFQMKEGSSTEASSGTTQEPGNYMTQMQSAFDTDFSDVNIHEDSKTASDLGALAFTQGNNVHFAPGQFKPDTQSGKELIGHELTHVVQQREGKVQTTKQIGKFNINDNSGLEKQADTMGAKAARYTPVQAKSISGFSGNSINSINQPIQKTNDADYVKHINTSDSLMSGITDGQLVSKDIFNKITYEGTFTGSGTAKKATIGLIEKINKELPKIVSDGSKKTTVRNLNKDELLKAQRYFYILRGIASSWADERSDDPNRIKRAYGFQLFIDHTDSLLNDVSAWAMQLGASDDEMVGNIKEATEDASFKEIQKHYADRSGSSIISGLSPVVEKLAPDKNSSGKVNVKVEIPIEPTGIAFLGGEMTLEAEKGEKTFKTRAQLDFIAGAKIPLFKITGKLGGYIEAEGADAKQSLNLISYGMHKRFKESTWLSPFADWAWGGKDKAKAFRNAVESGAFGAGSDAYVELGGIAEAKGEIGAEEAFVKGEVSIKGNMGKRYDKDTKGELKGKNVKGFGVGGKISIGPVSGEFTYDRGYTDKKLDKSELGIGLSTTHGGTMKVVEIIQKIQEVFGTVKGAVEKEEDPQAALIISEAKTKATEKIQGAIEGKLGIKSGDSGLGLSVTFNFIDKEVEIKLSTTSEKSLDLGVASAKAEFSKQEFSKTFNW